VKRFISGVDVGGVRYLVYGVNAESEDFNHITHIVILSKEEAENLELDFEAFWERYGHRAIALVPEEE